MEQWTMDKCYNGTIEQWNNVTKLKGNNGRMEKWNNGIFTNVTM